MKIYRTCPLVLVFAFALMACEQEFATIDSDIINADTASSFETTSEIYDVISYTNALDPVQTNGFGINMLGVFEDQIYGKTTASFVSQLSLSSVNPDFGANVELDSVVLTIPFFSTRNELDESTGRVLYDLDSVFPKGDTHSPIKLTLYENNYFLRDFDPTADFDSPQAFFSNKSASSTEQINEMSLQGNPITYQYYNEDGTVNTSTNLQFSSQEILLTEPDDDTDEDTDPQILFRLTPSIRLVLDNEYWENLIINQQGTSVLSNQNNFNNYFKGIYFKIEEINGEGSLALLDFSSENANIRLYYTRDSANQDEDSSEVVREQSTYVLNFGPNSVNFLENDFSLFTPVDGNEVEGDERLYLKGGEGAIASLKIFNGENDDDDDSTDNTFEAWKKLFVNLDEEGNFESSRRLINDAFLVFYVDQDMVSGVEPDRIYVYNKTDGVPLADYFQDAQNFTLPSESLVAHLGDLEKDEMENGVKYKVRITSHINNLLTNNTENVELGVSVSGNVNLEGTLSQRAVQTPDNSEETVPISSLITPRGTVLHGNMSQHTDKRLYLEIFYSCLENCPDD